MGSANFDLGVPERGYQLKTTYGSFGQARIVGIVAPREADDETFAAFSLRETQGFGQDRASQSASINTQYGVDLGDSDHLRVVATAYAAHAALPGVVRQDDVNAGRIDYYGAYPSFNSYFPQGCTTASCAEPAQGVERGARDRRRGTGPLVGRRPYFALAPWVMWTNFLSRQNYTGDLDSSNLQPWLPTNLGDLWQLTNVETAAGVTARFRAAPMRVGNFLEVVAEPGVFLRGGHTDQSRSLVEPRRPRPLGLPRKRRARYHRRSRVRRPRPAPVETPAHFGGVRADFLAVTINDNLAGVVPPVPTGALHGEVTNVAGVAPGPRGTVSYDIIPELTLVSSVGEGFRSLDAASLTLCNTPTIH